MTSPKNLAPAQAKTSSSKPNSQPSPGAIGNTPGLITPQPSPNGGIEAGKASPLKQPARTETPAEKGLIDKALDLYEKGNIGFLEKLQKAGLDKIDVMVESSGYSMPAMVAGAIGKAALEVFMPTNVVDLVPGCKGASLTKKGADATGALKKGKKATEAAKDTGKADNAKPVGKEDGGYSKGKKKLKCGEYGQYGDLKKKTGEGKFDRDHIPSKAALKKRASELLNRKLKPWEEKAIDDRATAIAIPRQAHIDVSPTYGQTAAEAARDAKNLAGSARRDVEAMLKKIDEYDADGGCKKAYQRSARKVLRMDNNDFDKFLVETLKKR